MNIIQPSFGLPAALQNLNAVSVWKYMSAAQIADVQTGTPTLDCTTAVNTALAAAAAATPPFAVHVPAGVYGLSGTLVIDTGAQFVGEGEFNTIWQRLSGSSAAMLQSKDFATLVGTAATSSPGQFGIWHMSFDGNKFNTSGTADNIDLFGYDYDVHYVSSYKSRNAGFFSQFALTVTIPNAAGPEARLSNIKTHHCDGHGFVYQGPNDSHISHLLSFINKLDGIRVEDGATFSAGGTMLSHLHSYYNCVSTVGYCVYINSPVYIDNVIGESCQTGGTGIYAGTGGFVMGGVLHAYSNLGPGIVIAGDNSVIEGVIATGNTDALTLSGNTNVINGYRCTSNSGIGVKTTGNTNIVRNGVSTGNGTNYSDSGTGNAVAAGAPVNNKAGISAPTAPSSTSAYTMQGTTVTFTPGSTGIVLIIISGTIIAPTGTTVNNGIRYQISYGTGSAPTNGAALTGTQTGRIQTYTSAIAPTAAADVHVPFSVNTTVAGLTLGTTYWIDLAAQAITTASQMGLENVQVVVWEK